MNEQKTQRIKQFLRWAGAKTWFVKNLNDFIPKNEFNDYREPFLGGGAVFHAID